MMLSNYITKIKSRKKMYFFHKTLDINLAIYVQCKRKVSIWMGLLDILHTITQKTSMYTFEGAHRYESKISFS